MQQRLPIVYTWEVEFSFTAIGSVRIVCDTEAQARDAAAASIGFSYHRPGIRLPLDRHTLGDLCQRLPDARLLSARRL